MKKIFVALNLLAAVGFAHNSYTGGYSGASGGASCASSCHGGTGGSILVTGFPTSYQPQHAYRIVVKRNGGSLIVNFNATTRVGSTSTVAGTFGTTTNTALYGGADGGVYASPHAIDSAVFQWTAPSAGTGAVNFYVSAYQGTTSSASGQSSGVTRNATESTTSANEDPLQPVESVLLQNYPNPFNPTTNITFQLSVASHVTLAIYDITGKETATIVNGVMGTGIHSVGFDAGNLATGIYFYRLVTNTIVQTRKMIVAR